MTLVIEPAKYEWVKHTLMIGKDKSFIGNICDMGQTVCCANALKSIVKYHHQKTETYFVDDTLQLELFLLHKAM